MVRLTPGRLAVLAIVFLGVSLAAFNAWYRYATTHRIHEHFGTEAMLQIADAPKAEWWELVPHNPAEESSKDIKRIEIDERSYTVDRSGDLADARGFVHLRYSLGQDASYSFSGDREPPRQWRWAIVFSEDRGEESARTIVLVDPDAHWLALLEANKATRAVQVSDKIGAGLKTFFAERTPADAK